MVRRTIYFSGRVQGVGFRYTVRGAARGHPVTGFVRNLDDGRVELVAEGEEREIDALVEEIRDRMSDYIAQVSSTTSPATAQFDGFTIRH